MLRKLNLPEYRFDIRDDKGKMFIFDPVRKKEIRLTPEEWVRQNIIMYLSVELGYPFSHMVLEKSLKINQCAKRCDILVYDYNFDPALLVECKAPEVEVSTKVFEQVARYNIAFKVPYLVISNGTTHRAAFIDHVNKTVKHLDHIPAYPELASR